MAKSYFKQPRKDRSALHTKVRELLRKLFPGFGVGEEVPIRVNGSVLYVDLMVKELQVVVECHGKQHFEYIEHFHGNHEGFVSSQQRDADKARAVRESGYAYVVVRYDESNLTAKRLLAKIKTALAEKE